MKSGRLRVDDVSKEGMTALMLAVDNRFSEATISELISMGSDVNARDSEGMTALHISTTLND